MWGENGGNHRTFLKVDKAGIERIFKNYPVKYMCLYWYWNRTGGGNGRTFLIKYSIQREQHE